MEQYSAAEQLYLGKLKPEGTDTSEKKLFIDLDICASGECKNCTIQCSYHYHPDNIGVVSVAELATYALVCRRCEEPHCVNACPEEALEQLKECDNMLVRHPMRCISCKTCSHACPYGTIYPENVPYLVHNCDFCISRRESKDEPLCITTCPDGALQLMEVPPALPEKTFLVGDNLIVHSTHWDREKA